MMQKQYKFDLGNECDKAKYQSVMVLLRLAYKDYLASRTLLRTKQLFRGTILANTCLEKYFKVFLAIKGNKSKTHNTLKLLKTVENFDSQLAKTINKDYIEFLSRSYYMRYYDNDVFNDSKNEFNICICKNKVLAELDYIVNTIETRWEITQGTKELERQYNRDMVEQKDLLVCDNYIFKGISKKEFVENQLENVLELRNSRQMGLVEVIYVSEKGRDDGVFTNQALVQKDS